MAFETRPLGNFLTHEPLPLIERRDYEVFRYQKMEPPPASAFLHSNDGRRGPKVGCLEEQYCRGVRGHIDDGAETVRFDMPEECLLPVEHDPLKLIIPDTKIRAWVGLPTDYHECDLEYMLGVEEEPLLRDFHYCFREPFTLAACGIEVLGSNFPTWHEMFREHRQCPDRLENFDPLPSSTAEGGGKLGPRICGDVSGEKISFLPPGGVPGDRDIPSETDSDGRDEDFAMPRPDIKEYLKEW